MKRKILIILPFLLFIFLFSGCASEKNCFQNEIAFCLTLKKDGSITQTISFPTQEEEMNLSLKEKTTYVEELTRELKTTLFFSYFYNFFTTSATSTNQEYKIGGEMMNYALPTYNENDKTVTFDFFFANSEVWDFYHPKGEEDDSYKVESGFFVDKGVSSGNFLFGEKLIINDREQTIGEYFYTILSTVQSKFSTQQLSKPSFSYKYTHHSTKLRTNADLKEEKDGLYSNVWNASYEELDEHKKIEIFAYSPNRATWYTLALGITVLAVSALCLIENLKNKKMQKKEKI